MITAEVAHRNRHIVNDALGEFVRFQEKVGTVLGFTQNIGHAVGLYKFTLVVSVVVYVLGGVRGGHHGECCKGEGLRLGFLQVVSCVVPAALQGAFFRCIAFSSHGLVVFNNNHLAAAVFGMARSVEPGLGIATALDAEELQGGILCHGVNVVAHNEGARDFVTDFDTQAFVGGYILRDFADKDIAFRSGDFNFVAHLVVCSGICTSNNCPVALGCRFGCGKRSGNLGAERLAVCIHDFKFRRLAAHKVELAFRIALEVARLVHADWRNLCVDGVEVGLV